MFNEFLSNIRSALMPTDIKNISIYPVGVNNLEGIKILIDNCFRMGSDNHNVSIATVDPSLWLGSFLDTHWNNIQFVSTSPSFTILKVEGDKIISKTYQVATMDFNSYELLGDFFEKNKWKTLVLFSITKYVDLVKLTTSYRVRIADTTEKYEERDNKINEILK